MWRSRGSACRTTLTSSRRSRGSGPGTSSLLARRTSETWWRGTSFICPASDKSESPPHRSLWTEWWLQGSAGGQRGWEGRLERGEPAQESGSAQTEIFRAGQSLHLLCLGLLHRHNSTHRQSQQTAGLTRNPRNKLIIRLLLTRGPLG